MYQSYAQLRVAEIENEAGRRLIARSLFLRAGAVVTHAFNGVDRRYLGLRPNDAIQWHAIRDAWRDRYRIYNLGEVSDRDDTLGEFKRKWGASAEMMCRYYYPPAERRTPRGPGSSWTKGAATRGAMAIWSRVPLRVTAAVGDAIWRFT
jgi:lipid II:glycine glycyltransferase (peptidoglycan interpeptide bridge formation enzyme)